MVWDGHQKASSFMHVFAYLRSFVCLRIGMNSDYIDYTHDKVSLISDYGKCTSRNSPRTFGTNLVHIKVKLRRLLSTFSINSIIPSCSVIFFLSYHVVSSCLNCVIHQKSQ